MVRLNCFFVIFFDFLSGLLMRIRFLIKRNRLFLAVLLADLQLFLAKRGLKLCYFYTPEHVRAPEGGAQSPKNGKCDRV